MCSFSSYREISHGSGLEAAQAYIKKPLNAFMLFLQEQKKLLSSDLLQHGSRVVNTHLGSMVRVFQPSTDRCNKKKRFCINVYMLAHLGGGCLCCFPSAVAVPSKRTTGCLFPGGGATEGGPQNGASRVELQGQLCERTARYQAVIICSTVYTTSSSSDLFATGFVLSVKRHCQRGRGDVHLAPTVDTS